MKTLPALATALALATTLIALAPTTHAQTLDLDFQSVATPVETSPFKINSSWQVRLEYNLPTGTYTNTKIELTLPDAATHPFIKVLNLAQPGAWTSSLTQLSPTQPKYTFTLSDTSAASTISGAIIVTLRAESLGYIVNDRYFTKSGTPFPFTARLTGTLNGGTPFDVSATNTQTVVGQATVHWQIPMSPYYTMNDRIAGNDVFIIRYDLRSFVCGNAPIAGADDGYGLPIRVKLGSKLHFLRSWWGGNNGFWPVDDQTNQKGTISYSPIPYGTPGHSPGGYIDANWNTTLAADPVYGCDFTQNFYVDLVFECSGTWDDSDPDFQMQVVDQDDNDVPVQPVQLAFDGTPTFVPLPAIDSTHTYSTNACGGPILVKKSSDNKASPAAVVDWQITVNLPVGGLPSPGTLVVDRLPTDSTSQLNLWMLKPIGPLAATTIWACDLRSEPAVAYFDNAALTAYKNNGKCRAAINSPIYPVQWTVPPLDMNDVTHVVWALPDDVTTQEDGVARSMIFQLQTYVPTTQASPYTNCSQVVGTVGGMTYSDVSLEPFGTPNPPSDNDPAEDCATKSIPAFACNRLEVIKDTPQTMSPGSCGAFYFRTLKHSDGLISNNPDFDIDLPPGIIVKNAPGFYTYPDGDGVGGSCTDGTPLRDASFVTATPTSVGNGVDPLTETTRVHIDLDRAPACGIQTWSFNYYIEFCIAEDWPWADGQALSFTMNNVSGDNLGTAAQCNSLSSDGYTWTGPQTTSFTLSVPPEMRSYVAPLCQGDGGAAFVVEGLNSGGVDLPDATLTFAIPEGATFQDVEDVQRPAGSRYEVSANDSDWVALGALSASAVRHVRLTNSTLPALVDNRLAYRVLVAVTGTEAVLTGRSSLTVNPAVIGTPAAGIGYFEDGSCAPVTLTKYHDLDGDNVHDDPTEPVLSGWSFVVTTAEGGFVASGTTDASGTWSLLLPSGDYIASEVLPADADGPSWTSTSTVDWAFEVAIGHGPLAHAFGNVCRCDEVDEDLCSERTCDRVLGQGRIASAADYACQQHPIDCGGSACAPNACDPEVGCVATEFEACSPMIYFLPARDTTTQRLVAFRCEVPIDGVSPPVCATDEQGALLVFPDQGGACGGGGAK